MTKAIWISIISAIVTPIISGFISYFISRRTVQIDTFNKASIRLNEAFREELMILKQHEMKYLVEIVKFLDSAFSKHSAVVAEFKATLSKSRRSEFDKVWKRYNGDEGDGRVCFGQYSNGLGGTGSQGAIQNIEAILKFTEHKTPLERIKEYYNKLIAKP